MTIEQRLERLERQNRWMRRGGALLVAAVACVVLMGQGKAKPLPDLVAKSLSLKTEDGLRWFWAGPDNTGGFVRVGAEDGGWIELRAESGQKYLAVFDKPTAVVPRLILGTKNGTPMVQLLREDHAACVLIREHKDGHGTVAVGNGNKLLWQAPPPVKK